MLAYIIISSIYIINFFLLCSLVVVVVVLDIISAEKFLLRVCRAAAFV